MSDDLKPCPFCGWDAPYVRTTGIETEVYCQNCTAVGPMVHSVGPDEDVDEVAIKMWSRRADAATIKAAVEMMSTEHGWVRRERLETAVNRIEELERERDEALAAQSYSCIGKDMKPILARDLEDAKDAAEAKLAKAVEYLQKISRHANRSCSAIAARALAELEGK